MRKYYFILLLCGVLTGAEESPFDDFIVGVWPEYDHPGVLLIYTGIVKENYLPVLFEVLVPREALMAVGVGHVDTSDALMPLDLTERSDGKWISITLVKTEFQIQIYYNPFKDSDDRQIDLQLKFNQPINEFHIAVQKPLGATESFQFSELNSEEFTDEHGLIYHRVHVGELPAGETKEISVSYRNPNRQLTVDLLREMLDSGPGGESQSAQEVQDVYRLPTYEPLAVLGVVTFIIGFIFWRSNNRNDTKSLKKGKGHYCTNCGKRIRPDNKYCSKCGNKVQ